MNYLTSLLLPVLLYTNAAPPFLGVSTSVHDQPVEIAGQTFLRGLRVELVVTDSAAEQAGLLEGDIIVALDGTSFDCPADQVLQRFQETLQTQKVGDLLSLTVFRDRVERDAHLDDQPVTNPAAWNEPDILVADAPPGTRLTLTATHVRKLLNLTSRLGQRPSDSGIGTFRIPSNSEIMPGALTLSPATHLAEQLIDQFNARADYTRLRERLAALVEQGDAFRLPLIAYAFREPMALEDLADQLDNIPTDPAGALRHAGRMLNLEVPARSLPALRTGLTAEEHAAQIERLLTSAHEHYEQALANLTDAEREFLEQTLPEVSDAFREFVMVLSDEDHDRRARVQRFCSLLVKVDRGALLAAAIELSALLDRDYLAGLQQDLRESDPGIFITHDTPYGPIVLAGWGDSWHQESAAVRIDLGGNDRYTHQTQQPFSISINLQGDDTYQATSDFAQGAAQFGVSLLYDHDGDDTYIAQQWSQGAAAVGVGLLLDACGNDYYRAQDYSQSAALAGVGLLIDHAGDDRYDAPRYAQAIAMPGAFAALVDSAGSDWYFCSGRDATGYGVSGVFDAFGQGCGIGFRGLASGGIALLRDDAGDDHYFGGNFAQGGGYYFGWGTLIDRAGDDIYRGSRYAQAWAAHQALGFLADDAGNDLYECWRGVGQSCSWDETVTMLIERAGDDFYLGGGGFACCAAHNNGWALLIDHDGQDSYSSTAGVPRADGDDEVTSFSLWLDLGGADDVYPQSGHNNQIKHGNRHGLFGDLPADLENAAARYQEFIRP